MDRPNGPSRISPLRYPRSEPRQDIHRLLQCHGAGLHPQRHNVYTVYHPRKQRHVHHSGQPDQRVQRDGVSGDGVAPTGVSVLNASSSASPGQPGTLTLGTSSSISAGVYAIPLIATYGRARRSVTAKLVVDSLPCEDCGGEDYLEIDDVYYAPGSTSLVIYGEGFGYGGFGKSATVSNVTGIPVYWTDGEIDMVLSMPLPAGTNSVDVVACDDEEGCGEVEDDFLVDSSPPTVYMQLSLIGTVINSSNNYSEDSTIRVTAVDANGNTLTNFTGTVNLGEQPVAGNPKIYTQNGGYLPPSVTITANGTATFVAQSLAGPDSVGPSGKPPLDAIVITTNYPLYEGTPLSVQQWITTEIIDLRAALASPDNEGLPGPTVFNWLQARIYDMYTSAGSPLRATQHCIPCF